MKWSIACPAKEHDMDPNYDDYLDFTQELDNDEEYNAWLYDQELRSQEQELPEDYSYTN